LLQSAKRQRWRGGVLSTAEEAEEDFQHVDLPRARLPTPQRYLSFGMLI
jgi:hypothetical protein